MFFILHFLSCFCFHLFSFCISQFHLCFAYKVRADLPSRDLTFRLTSELFGVINRRPQEQQQSSVYFVLRI